MTTTTTSKPKALRQDWIDKARDDGRRDALCANTVFTPEKATAFLKERQAYLLCSKWERLAREGTLLDSDVPVLERAWCEGAGLNVATSKVSA